MDMGKRSFWQKILKVGSGPPAFGLTARLRALQGRALALQGRVLALEGRVLALEGRVSALEGLPDREGEAAGEDKETGALGAALSGRDYTRGLANILAYGPEKRKCD